MGRISTRAALGRCFVRGGRKRVWNGAPPFGASIRALHMPMLLLINMADELKKIGTTIDIPQLENLLGIPVVLIPARPARRYAGGGRLARGTGAGGGNSFAPEGGHRAFSALELRQEARRITQAVLKNIRSIHGFSAKSTR